MTNPSVNVGSLLVGEYVDEAEAPGPPVSPDAPVSIGRVERPRVVASYLDLWGQEDGSREFTVLLRDNRVITVRGDALKYVPHPANTDAGSYSVLVRVADEEVVVALFPISEVTGIFSGDLRSARESA